MSAARSITYLRPLGGIVAILTLLALAATPAFAQEGESGGPPSKQVRKPLEKLWSEYPLNPSPTTTDPRISRESKQTGTPQAETPIGASERSPAQDDGAPLEWVLVFVGAIAVVLAAASVPAVRRGLVPAPALSLPVRSPRPRHRGRLTRDLRRMPRRREGGLPMDHFVRRLLGKRDDNGDGAAVKRAAPEADSASIDHAKFLPYSLQPRSDAVSSEADKPAERSGPAAADESEVAVDARAVADAGDYTQVGEQVAAVLTSARQAADELLTAARADAERMLAQAEGRAEETVSAASREAEGLRREAGQLRSEAESYAEETRASADEYTDTARRLAEGERAKTIADAEERAREIQADAERRAQAIGAEALQRHQVLVREVGRSEERVHDLLAVFRGITSELEALVTTETEAPVDAEAPADTEVPVDAAMDDVLMPERVKRSDAKSDVAAGRAASR